MIIAEINMMNTGSTGNIMFGIAKIGSSMGHQIYTFSPYYYEKGQPMKKVAIKNHFYFGSLKETMIHYAFAEITGLHGCGSYIGTRQLIRQLDIIRPHIIHLHNLHNFTINIPELFKYIKREKIKTIWTLHDCWAMTGKCPHFLLSKCNKWKTGCYECPVLKEYPKSYIDQVRLMWKLKRRWFTGVDNMTLVTPSQWLADMAKESYLSEYPIKVINNGIDLEVFTPVYNNLIYSRYGIDPEKKIILGVAFEWNNKKGLDVFIQLSKELSNEYQVVLVGTNDKTDQIIPSNIISIHRTQNQKELVELYTIADVFLNPTREDTFPTVNIEALACGTPVITYRTGGSAECIDESCGICIECDDYESLKKKVYYVCKEKAFSPNDCIRRASKYEQKKCYKNYIELYENI